MLLCCVTKLCQDSPHTQGAIQQWSQCTKDDGLKLQGSDFTLQGPRVLRWSLWQYWTMLLAGWITTEKSLNMWFKWHAKWSHIWKCSHCICRSVANMCCSNSEVNSMCVCVCACRAGIAKFRAPRTAFWEYHPHDYPYHQLITNPNTFVSNLKLYHQNGLRNEEKVWITIH